MKGGSPPPKGGNELATFMARICVVFGKGVLVATKPWRAYRAEEALLGAKPGQAAYAVAAQAALEGARPQKYNAFKKVITS